jgi:hypothetical protein
VTKVTVFKSPFFQTAWFFFVGYFSCAQSQIACLPFAQSRKRKQKRFNANFICRPATGLKAKRKNSLQTLLYPNRQLSSNTFSFYAFFALRVPRP